MNRMKKSLAALLVAAMLIPTASVGADKLQNQLDSVKGKMKTEQANINYTTKKIANITGHLSQLQQDAEAIEERLVQIRADLVATEAQIAQNEVILRDAEQRLEVNTKRMHKRLRDIYINGRVNYLDVLVGAKDFNDFTTRMELLKRIASQDAALVNKVREERALILEKHQQLEADKARLVTLKQNAEDEQKRIDANKAEQQQLLAKMQKEKATSERAYNELLQTSRNIEAMIRKREEENKRAQQQGKSVTKVPVQVRGSGDLRWPLSSRRITSQFGWRIHPIFGTSKFHSGIDIGAGMGEPVWAAAGGVVIHSGWMGGYGKAVIIDHGGGLTTLYAHNSRLVVKNGETVKKGQVIAHAGSTGYSTGPHLHFEVRKYGKPVNPRSYM